jgi:hypothetical protein
MADMEMIFMLILSGLCRVRRYVGVLRSASTES